MGGRDAGIADASAGGRDGTEAAEGVGGRDAGIAGAGAGGRDANGAGGIGSGGQGGGGGPILWNGVKFPWPVFDGTIPDVPPSASGSTYYADPVNGNDSWDGSSFTFVSGSKGPKRTANAALAIASLKAGDTILLGGGIYREIMKPNTSGTESNPITVGSYGRGTGAPIIDAGMKPGAWTQYTAQQQKTVWQTSTTGLAKITSAQPVLGVYVNGPNGEFALREVMHGQVDPYPGDPSLPSQTQADIKDNSSDFYYDAANYVLYADFGGSLGVNGDPNTADVSILYKSHDTTPEGALDLGSVDYYTFVGLTLRAGSWGGSGSEGSGFTFDHCDIKFNGGGGLTFSGQKNTVKYSRVWMNVLDNWPRFNNGNTGGGWPGALVFYAARDSSAIGNVIYENGGEGLIFYGTENGWTGSGNVARNNVAFDNFSVNLYFDNTQEVLVEQNYAFEHPRDPSQTFTDLFTISPGYANDFGRRMTPLALSLADEPGSAYDSQAHLANITVINNILVGPRALVDYDDGTAGVGHGLKNCIVANNTMVVPSWPLPSGDPSYGWSNGSKAGADKASFVQNNLILVQISGSIFEAAGSGIGAGITDDYNLLSGPGTWSTGNSTQTFDKWKAAHSGWDVHSVAADALLTDVSEFNQTADKKPVYDWSKATPGNGSPARGAGVAQTTFTTDFTGATRPGEAYDIGAIAVP